MLDTAICGFVDKVRRLFTRVRVFRSLNNRNFQALHGCMEELRGCYSDDEFVEIKKTSYTLLQKVLDNLGTKFDLSVCDNEVMTAELRSSTAERPKSFVTVLLTLIMTAVLARNP